MSQTPPPKFQLAFASEKLNARVAMMLMDTYEYKNTAQLAVTLHALPSSEDESHGECIDELVWMCAEELLTSGTNAIKERFEEDFLELEIEEMHFYKDIGVPSH